jgi:hypothetical protein
MVVQLQQPGVLAKIGIGIWLLIGPFLGLWLLGMIGVRLPPLTHNDSIDAFLQMIPGGVLGGIALFFLRVPLWQRTLSFVLYAPIAGVLTLYVALFIGCYVFHDCL